MGEAKRRKKAKAEVVPVPRLETLTLLVEKSVMDVLREELVHVQAMNPGQVVTQADLAKAFLVTAIAGARNLRQRAEAQAQMTPPTAADTQRALGAPEAEYVGHR